MSFKLFMGGLSFVMIGGLVACSKVQFDEVQEKPSVFKGDVGNNNEDNTLDPDDAAEEISARCEEQNPDDQNLPPGGSLKAGHGGDSNTKVAICHVPSGNSANRHTIVISVNALAAHIGRHGADGIFDTIGPCGNEPGVYDTAPPEDDCDTDVDPDWQFL
jgi:hypothetical protein